MIQKSASRALLEQLAAEHRHVVSDWRALLLVRRATFELRSEARRWSKLPGTPNDVRRLLAQMERTGDLRRLDEGTHLYQVTAPYANSPVVDDYDLLMELHPYATIAYQSALAFHNLTLQLPQIHTALVSTDHTGSLLPIGTTAEDWEDLMPVRGRKVSSVNGRKILWSTTKPANYFGFREYDLLGVPIRVMTPERTLVDCLLFPERCGGVQNSLSAWAMARDYLNIAEVIQIVDRLDIGVLRQRVGYVLETLGHKHEVLNTWQQVASRGGSSKLIGDQPYSRNHSARWNLSINTGYAILDELVA